MRHLLIINISVVCLLACSPKIVEQVRTVKEYQYRDSVIYRDTTLFVQLPQEMSAGFVAQYDTSHLETSIAESDAWTDSTGLHHSLQNKNHDALAVNITYPKHIIVEKARDNTTSALVRTVYVEKKLTLAQQVKLKLFWFFVLIVAGCFILHFKKI